MAKHTGNNTGNNNKNREPVQIDAAEAAAAEAAAAEAAAAEAAAAEAAAAEAAAAEAAAVATVPGLRDALNARKSVYPAVRGPALLDAAKAAKTWTTEQLATAKALASGDAALSAVFAAESVRRAAREESASVKAAIRERDKGLALETAATSLAAATARGARESGEVRDVLADNVTTAAVKARDALADNTLPLHDAIGEAIKPLRQTVAVMTGARKVLTGDIRGASGKNAAAVLGLLYR